MERAAGVCAVVLALAFASPASAHFLAAGGTWPAATDMPGFAIVVLERLLPQSPGTGSDLWALFFTVGQRDGEDLAAPVFRRAAKQDFKIAWSMDGTGDLTVVGTTASGETLLPLTPPSLHGGTWRGSEWGTVFVFPHAGCWRLTATRGSASGFIDVEVT